MSAAREFCHAARSVGYAARMIEAGGGVIWRVRSGELQVLLIHRPGRDWSLPKGKQEPDESIIECAMREVAEETGFRCAPGPELPSTEYTDRKGRPKRVRYWAMTIVSGSFVPNPEADEIRWLSIDDALNLVTANRDIAVVGALRHALTKV